MTKKLYMEVTLKVVAYADEDTNLIDCMDEAECNLELGQQVTVEDVQIANLVVTDSK